jgi:uncharacterized membrane protein YhfC
MNILYITYFINGFLMIAIPIFLATYLTRKFKQSWRLFWIGAATFIFSQILHIPFNNLVSPIFKQSGFITLPIIGQILITAAFLGISAGVFEELSRYAMYRWFAKDARSWGRGLLAGAGHGGAEAIILGALALYAYLQLVSLRGANLEALVPAGQLEATRAQITAYWSASWYMTLLGALERLFAITIQLACSLLVLQAFTRKQFWWVCLAISYHALVDGVTVFASGMRLSAMKIEGIVGIFAIVSVGIIIALRNPETIEESIPIKSVHVPEFSSKPIEETEENLDKTRYQ